MYGPAKLLADYVSYWELTHHVKQMRREHWVRSPVLTTDRCALLEKFELWCGEHELDARRWLAALFYVRRFMYAPTWKHLMSDTPKAREFYHRKEMPEYDQKIRRELSDGQQVENPNVDVIPAAEIRKQSYAESGDPTGCMIDFASTYGWHPRSRVCQQCVIAGACRQQLSSRSTCDLVALREGRITWEEAKRKMAQGNADARGRGATSC